MIQRTVKFGDSSVKSVQVNNTCPLVLIAGPCVLESREHALEMSQALKEMTERLSIIFTSY